MTVKHGGKTPKPVAGRRRSGGGAAVAAPPEADRIHEMRLRLSPAPGRALSQQRFSQLLGVSWSTVARWEGGGRPDPWMRAKLDRLARLLDLIGGMLQPAHLVEFLERPHPLLMNLRPIDLLDTEAGEKALAGLIEGAETGAFA